MKKILLAIGILAALVTILVFVLKSPKPAADQSVLLPPPLPEREIVEFEAAFAIFTNGTFRIFTDSMYHNLSDEAFIEMADPNVVHVKKAGVTWDDFFKTLPFQLSHDCLTTGTGQTFCNNNIQTLKFFLNGQLKPDALDREINSGDQLLISYGNEKEDEIQSQLQRIPSPR